MVSDITIRVILEHSESIRKNNKEIMVLNEMTPVFQKTCRNGLVEKLDTLIRIINRKLPHSIYQLEIKDGNELYLINQIEWWQNFRVCKLTDWFFLSRPEYSKEPKLINNYTALLQMPEFFELLKVNFSIINKEMDIVKIQSEKVEETRILKEQVYFTIDTECMEVMQKNNPEVLYIEPVYDKKFGWLIGFKWLNNNKASGTLVLYTLEEETSEKYTELEIPRKRSSSVETFLRLYLHTIFRKRIE